MVKDETMTDSRRSEESFIAKWLSDDSRRQSQDSELITLIQRHWHEDQLDEESLFKALLRMAEGDPGKT